MVVNIELSDNAASWLKHGHRGASSDAIFSKMTGLALSRLWQDVTPSDPSDFKRCMDLLDAIPEFANRMQEMKEVSEQWAAVVDYWDELVQLKVPPTQQNRYRSTINTINHNLTTVRISFHMKADPVHILAGFHSTFL